MRDNCFSLRIKFGGITRHTISNHTLGIERVLEMMVKSEVSPTYKFVLHDFSKTCNIFQ